MTLETSPGALDVDGRAARWRAGMGLDVVALAVLALLVVAVQPHDGGRELSGLRLVAGAGLLATPLVLTELRRIASPWSWLVASWSLAPLVVLALAEHRAAWVSPTLIMTIVPAASFSVARAWRRQVSRRVVGAIVLVAGVLYWADALQVWLVTADGTRSVEWLALSWRNPSAALMAAFGLSLTGASVAGPPTLRVLAGATAASCLAVVPLTGSRSVVPLVGVFFVALVTFLVHEAAGRRARRGVLLTAMSVLALAATLHVSLADVRVDAPAAATGVAASTEDAAGSTSRPAPVGRSLEGSFHARVDHVVAAGRMFAASPLDGHGFGSYGPLLTDHARPGETQSISAHNEYAEVAAEGGLVALLPFLALLGALAVTALRGLRDPGTHARGWPAAAGLVAGAGLVGVHMAWDFDWRYPVLVAVVGIGGGVGLALAAFPPRRQSAAHWLGSMAYTLLVVVSTFGLWWQYGPGVAPWEEGAMVARAADHREAGMLAEADAVVDRGLAFNPSSPRLALERARQGLSAGDAPSEIMQAFGEARRYRAARLRFASDLAVAGEVTAAQGVLDQAVVETASDALLVVEATAHVAAARGGCSAMLASITGAAERVEQVATPTERRRVLPMDPVATLTSELRDTYC